VIVYALRRSPVKGKSTIVYWEFTIDIVGPWHDTKSQREEVRKLLPRKRLKEIEQAAWLATIAKLPPGFRAVLS
jgi:hypothetical protein